jgi:hypothetical protein
VLEVTVDNWSDDLCLKVDCYAQAGIPVYLIGDRKHDEVLLYTDPADGKYPAPSASSAARPCLSRNSSVSPSTSPWTPSWTATTDPTDSW